MKILDRLRQTIESSIDNSEIKGLNFWVYTTRTGITLHIKPSFQPGYFLIQISPQVITIRLPNNSGTKTIRFSETSLYCINPHNIINKTTWEFVLRGIMRKAGLE